MLCYFKKSKTATETHTQKVCAVCGDGAVTDRTCQKWFARFRAGDVSLDDAPGRADQLRLIEIQPRH